jgi:hypothetical protein
MKPTLGNRDDASQSAKNLLNVSPLALVIQI